MSMRRAATTLLFLAAAAPIGALALGVLIAGWVVVTVLAITPLVVPALVGFRLALGATARLDAGLANGLLGTNVEPSLRSPGGRGFWRAGWNVLQDPAFWRQQTYLLLRMTVGFGVALAEWTLLATSLGLLSLPIWYRWSSPELGNWTVDTLGRALLGVPLGLVGLVIAVALLRLLAALSRRLVDSLLGAGTAEQPRRFDGKRALRTSVVAYVAVNVPLVVIWALTGAGYFWPEWILLPLALPLAVSLVLLYVATPRFQLVGIAAVFVVFFRLCWMLTGRGYFWPIWPILAVLLALIAAGWALRSRRRIARLEETRAGAVDQQEVELARIERDLHDGAQARLVALGMNLGMAEQKFASDPEAAQALLAEARRGTHEALEELRSLARGIRPPVLADRGLRAAIDALAQRTPLQVRVTVDVPERLTGALETTAYYVVAEALANTGKHANAESVDIDVHTENSSLIVNVVDNGAGGANANGSGLRGLGRRVEAVDGTLDVTSPVGGPTTVRAVLPCA
jgi:signal transduction histidine kinase